MNISSNYYNNYYYNQSLYSLNTTSTIDSSNESNDSSQSTTDAVDLSTRRPPKPLGSDISNMNLSVESRLNSRGKMVRDSLQMQNSNSSEMSEQFEALKESMEELKSTDIDSMTADDIKETLTNILENMKGMQKPNKVSNDTTEIDMSESDMKDMLEKLQEHANRMSAMGEMQPLPLLNDNSSDLFSQMKEDIEELKTVDIDSMTSDEIKEMLTQLKADMEAMPKPSRQSNNDTTEIDIDSMSESDMSDLLKEIKEHALELYSSRGVA